MGLLPLTLIALFLCVWGGCGGSEWTEMLPNGYSIADWGRPDRVLLAPGNEAVFPDDPSVSRRGVSGGFVFGVHDSGEYFLVDTATGSARRFEHEAAWREALNAAGVSRVKLREPGPTSPDFGVAFLMLFVTVPGAFIAVSLCTHAWWRRKRAALLLSADPVFVATSGSNRRIRRCPGCRYDLGGCNAEACAECGRAVPWIPESALRRVPPATWPSFLALALGLLPNLWVVRHLVVRPSVLSYQELGLFLTWVSVVLFVLLTAPAAVCWTYLLILARRARPWTKAIATTALVLAAWAWAAALVLPDYLNP